MSKNLVWKVGSPTSGAVAPSPNRGDLKDFSKASKFIIYLACKDGEANAHLLSPSQEVCLDANNLGEPPPLVMLTPTRQTSSEGVWFAANSINLLDKNSTHIQRNKSNWQRESVVRS
ncbi:Uncharacterized protein Fot_35497 [Forsythia ovata]|uniref:Uncharacterized protein n=1 Tax=Forsythia ovata TaxID=205694 RepID=A0ABD1SLP1_9LAMI